MKLTGKPESNEKRFTSGNKIKRKSNEINMRKMVVRATSYGKTQGNMFRFFYHETAELDYAAILSKQYLPFVLPVSLSIYKRNMHNTGYGV
jgi:hypothetical protein